MKEVFKQKEIPATESEIKKTVDGWWEYLDRKMKVHRHLSRGITPGLVADGSEGAKAIKFSLAENIAPELAGFGRLVNAKTPHVYVEGIRDPDLDVPFNELYLSESLQPKKVFTADQNNKLPGYLAARGIQPDRFLLYIYTTNDIEQIDRLYRSVILRELVFFTSKDSKLNALDLKSGWRGIYPQVKGPLWLERSKSLGIRPATHSQIAITQEGFRGAISQLRNI